MPTPTLRPAVAKTPIPTDEAACRRQGGIWQKGLITVCYHLPSTDGGQPCSDDSECQGWCDPSLSQEAAGEALQALLAGQALGLMTGTCSRTRGEGYAAWWHLSNGHLEFRADRE